MSDPDAPPPRERARYSVNHWGDLEVGDVVRVRGEAGTIARIEPHPELFDLLPELERINKAREGKTEKAQNSDGQIVELPKLPLTLVEMLRDPRWQAIYDDPRQVVFWFTTPSQPVEHPSIPLPVHGSMGWQVLVAVGPDAHFEVCGSCGFLWPCPHTSTESDAKQILYAEANRCQHCGNQVSNGQHVVKAVVVDEWGPHEVKFHGRKGPCLKAALRMDPENVAEQRARYDAWSDDAARWRAWRAEHPDD